MSKSLLKLRVFTTDKKHARSFNIPLSPGDDPAVVVSKFIGILKDEFQGNEFQCVKIGNNRYSISPIPLHSA